MSLPARRVRSRLLTSVLSTVAILATLLGVQATASPAQAADRDCSDFSSQAAAQAFYLANGGPAVDPHRLDSDGDGIVCETLPCPCDTNRPPRPPATPTCNRTPKLVQKAVVEYVIDGDTLGARINGQRSVTSVRLLGINSPERGAAGYAAATASLRKRAPVGATVTLVSDPTQARTDRFGRALRYVQRGSADLSKAQLTAGWARYFDVRTCAPLQRKQPYLKAQGAARRADRGIWR